MLRFLLVCLAVLLGSVGPGWAQPAFPTHPIRFVVPFAAGGGTDAQCRILAEAAGRRLGQTIIVDNLTGAGGTIGFAAVARAAPDGYTILSTTPGFAINPYIQKSIGYDPDRDFAAVIEATVSPVLLVVAADSPFHTVQDLLDLGRNSPGKLRYGSAGIGSIAHLSSALFVSLAGVKATHVPYRGSDPAILDLLAGRVQFLTENVTSVLPGVRSGQMRAIAVGTAKPSALLPGVPTIAAAVPGYESSAWFGILAPAGTPEPVISRLNAAFNESLADPQVQTQLSAFGVEIVGGAPAVFDAFLKARRTELKSLAQTANLVPQ